MPAINADVVLVAEGGDGEIDARSALLARFGLGVFDRPARIAVLLAQLGGLLCPFCRDAAFLDVALLAVGVALLWRGDERGVDDLAAHRQKSGRREHRIEALEHNLDCRLTGQPGPRQCLAEGPDRVGVGHRVREPQAKEAHE